MAKRDPRDIPPQYPEEGEDYRKPPVRFKEGNLAGFGSSEQVQAEEAHRWERYGHKQDESDQKAPQPNGPDGHKPFAGLTNGK